jgi:hypothetical protein
MLSTHLLASGLAAALIALATACGSGNNMTTPDAASRCDPPPAVAPTYTQLYTKYFAPGTPGHCADNNCHNGAGFNTWLCGNTPDSCFRGMATMGGLINTANPGASLIADETSSPLSWINPRGFMPFDRVGAFPEGCAAIKAWVAAGAQNN